MQNCNVIFRILFLLILVSSCRDSDQATEEPVSSDETKDIVSTEKAWYAELTTIQGTTQGTTFTIKTSDDTLLLSPIEITKLFTGFDDELSGYIPTSMLSEFNSSDTLDISKSRFFLPCYELSQEIFQSTDGAFDPSVFPLVKAWGFFKEMNNPPEDEIIDSILQFTGFEQGKHHVFENGRLIKEDSRFQIDFNAIAQGQSVDVVAEFLDDKGQLNYYIEIGGEIRVKGVNDEKKPWVIGVDQPSEENTGTTSTRELENYLALTNIAVATSGSYRKFYVKDGKRFSHTINPKTGYPVQHNLLSATVVTESAAVADGYATAFMTMGVEKTMRFLKDNPNLGIEAYLLFENAEGRVERAYSNGMDNFLMNF